MDSRIALSFQSPRIEEPGNALARILGMQQMMRGNALQEMQMQQSQQAQSMRQQEFQQQQAQRAAQAEQQNALQSYLASISGDAGPPQPFNPAQAARFMGVENASKMQGLLNPPGDKPVAVSPGQQLVDPRTGRQVYAAPDKPTALPTGVQEYEYAKGQGFKGSYEQWVTAKAKAGAAQGSNVTLQAPVPIMLPDGSIGYAQPGNRPGAQPQVMTGPGGVPLKKPTDAKADKPMTEAQAKASAFKSQMEAAERELATVPLDSTKLWNQVDVGLAATPANIVSSGPAQRARQSQEQWAEAYLRFKTGAASTESEVKRNVRTFFPQAGDSQQVIEQKARMRKQAASDVGYAATGQQQSTKPAAGGWAIVK